MSESEELFDTFVQYSQRCTICAGWLLGDEELKPDPNHKWQFVHKDCIQTDDSESDNKKRYIELVDENPLTKLPDNKKKVNIFPSDSDSD